MVIVFLKAEHVVFTCKFLVTTLNEHWEVGVVGLILALERSSFCCGRGPRITSNGVSRETLICPKCGPH